MPSIQRISLVLLLQPVLGAVVSYDWTASWVYANPDQRANRPVIGINNQWPSPTINVTKGDNLIVKLTNSLGNQTLGLHWHGLHQNGTNAQDGPSGVTQCSLQPNQTYTYNFTAADAGTYWYHSHENGQYADGLRGPLIIKDPSPPFSYAQDAVLTVSDWYHDLMPTLLPSYLLYSQNPNGSEPVPYSALINDAVNANVPVVAGQTYYFHIINMAAFAQIFLEFQQHNITIVEIDGVYVQQRNVSQLYLANGQRYGVLLTAKTSATQNFPIVASIDTTALDTDPGTLNPNVTAFLSYNASNLPPVPTLVSQWNVLNELALIPYDKQPLLPAPDTTIYIDLGFFNGTDVNGNIQNRAGFNNTSYVPQTVPSLYTALSAGNNATNPLVYGNSSNPFVLPYLKVIDIVINNYDNGVHPMHIHGHQPQIVSKSANIFCNVTIPTNSNISTAGGNPAYPPRRDTWTNAQCGQTRIRFRADNPGVWFLHCHMEWHMSGGLMATLIEAPLQLQKNQPAIPSGMASVCSAQSVPTAGNAAGNTQNFLNLTGAPTVPKAATWGAHVK